MASTYSSKLGLQLPATNEQSGVWGDTTDLNFGKLIEQAIAGATVLDVTSAGGAYTPSSLDGSVDQARSAILQFTGTPGVATTITLPTKAKVYIVRNDTDGLLYLKTAAQVSPVEVGLDEANIFYCDGTDIKKGIEVVVSPILPVSKGGTGAGTFTAGIIKSPGGTDPLITEPTVGLDTIEVTNVLPVTNGGTGLLLGTPGGAAFGTGSTDIGYLVGSAAGQFIVSDGSAWNAQNLTLNIVTSFNGRVGAVVPQVGDYSSFYAQKDGTGASGTWGISISGNADYANTAGSAASVSNSSSNGYGTRTVSTSSGGGGAGSIHYQYQ